jgi:tetratricopeptide (TPR) repeat protein
MVRTVLTAVLVVGLTVLIGCQTTNSGRGQRVPTEPVTVPSTIGTADVDEVDIVEQVTVTRQAYRQSLETLVGYYTTRGDHMKLSWAKKELRAFDTMPKYKYIPDAEPAGPDLKASALIPEADRLFSQGEQLEKRAGPLPFGKNEELLRLALAKYNQVIREHPSSDKIDDAAFQAGGIYQYLKDYTIALLYYQRTYQWDPETIHPARFRAAFILDKYLHRRAEALALYQQAMKTEIEHEEWREFAEKRIGELTNSVEGG